MNADLYIGAVAAIGAAIIGASVRGAFDQGLTMAYLPWIGLVILTVLTGHVSLRLPVPNCKVSFSDGFIFLSLLLCGPSLATLTAALDGFAASARRGGTWHKRIFNTAAMAISMDLASNLFGHVLPQGSLAAGQAGLGRLVLAMLLLAVAQFVLNTALVSVAIALKEGVSFVAVWESSLSWVAIGYLAASAVAILIFLGVRGLGVGTLAAILPLPFVLYHSYRVLLSRAVVKVSSQSR